MTLGSCAQWMQVQIVRFFGVVEIGGQTYGGFETGGSTPAGSQIKIQKMKQKMFTGVRWCSRKLDDVRLIEKIRTPPLRTVTADPPIS